jgi:hypothetical protein
MLGDAHHPIPKIAQWNPQKKKLKASFCGVKKRDQSTPELPPMFVVCDVV